MHEKPKQTNQATIDTFDSEVMVNFHGPIIIIIISILYINV